MIRSQKPTADHRFIILRPVVLYYLVIRKLPHCLTTTIEKNVHCQVFKIITLLIIPCWVDVQSRLHVLDFSATECIEPTLYPEKIRTRIIEKIKDGILDLKIGATELCCLTFKPDIEFY